MAPPRSNARAPGKGAGALACALLAAAAHLPRPARAAGFDVQTGSLRITEPASIRGTLDSAIGDFGVPLYGATLVGEVRAPPSTANADGCKEYDAPLAANNNGAEPVIALISRGGCYFVEKVHNAQKAGAAAALIMDNVDEHLLTMANPVSNPAIDAIADAVVIPSALVTKPAGESIRNALAEGARVIVEMDWKESISHPDDRVEYELWTTSNDGCGINCERQAAFKRDFADKAIALEQAGHTLGTPHFLMWHCADDGGRESAAASRDTCYSQCIRNGRYCDPTSSSSDEGGADTIMGGGKGVSPVLGREVMAENLRQLCLHRNAAESGQSWLWWEYARRYAEECPASATGSSQRAFGYDCSVRIMDEMGREFAGGIDTSKVLQCVGNVDEDLPHPVLDEETKLQRGEASGRTQIILLPTVIINDRQYRGRLDVQSVMHGICAGFDETTEPATCLSGVMERNECTAENDFGGCWKSDSRGTFHACQDTFRGYRCECPEGFRDAAGENADGESRGKACEDIDECKEGTHECEHFCTNTVGSYTCSCRNGYRLVLERACMVENLCEALENGGCGAHATCTTEGDPEVPTSTVSGMSRGHCECEEGFVLDPHNRQACIKERPPAEAGISIGMFVIGSVIVVLLLATIGYSLYKWRLRSHMDHEIRSILTQYMPLDNAAGGAVGTGAGGPGDFEDAPTASGYGPPPAGSKKVELGMSSSTAKDKEDE